MSASEIGRTNADIHVGLRSPPPSRLLTEEVVVVVVEDEEEGRPFILALEIFQVFSRR